MGEVGLFMIVDAARVPAPQVKNLFDGGVLTLGDYEKGIRCVVGTVSCALEARFAVAICRLCERVFKTPSYEHSEAKLVQHLRHVHSVLNMWQYNEELVVHPIY